MPEQTTAILTRLEQLLPAQFHKLLYRYGMPPYYLPVSASQTEQAISLLRYAEQQQNTARLEKLLAEEIRQPFQVRHCFIAGRADALGDELRTAGLTVVTGNDVQNVHEAIRHCDAFIVLLSAAPDEMQEYLTRLAWEHRSEQGTPLMVAVGEGPLSYAMQRYVGDLPRVRLSGVLQALRGEVAPTFQETASVTPSQSVPPPAPASDPRLLQKLLTTKHTKHTKYTKN